MSGLCAVSHADASSCTWPFLPREILAVVFGHIEETPELLKCGLVCRTWLQFSRENFKPFIFRGRSVSRLAKILACPEHTLHNLIDLTLCTPKSEPLLPRLGAFTRLRALRLGHCTITTGLPALPSLTSLDLHRVEFHSYGIFVSIISNSPLLQSLTLFAISCTGEPEDEIDRPAFNLPSLHLRFLDENHIAEHIMFVLRPQKLILNLHGFYSSTLLSLISRYMLHLGPDLRMLELCYSVQDDTCDDDLLAQLDFSANVNMVYSILTTGATRELVSSLLSIQESYAQ